MSTEIVMHGAVVEGHGPEIIRRYAEEARREVAQEATNLLHIWFGLHFKHPTGRYESSIVTDLRQDEVDVNDHGVVYGPWLEGTGSRNYPKTKFKGYHSFRVVTQDLDRNLASEIAERVMDRYVRELNA